MNKQQGYSALVGAVITLGSITAVAAGNPPWRYDEESNRVIFSFSGPDILHSAIADNDMNNRQTANLPWHYDEASRRVIFAFSGPDIPHSAVADNDMNNRQTANLPWRYDEASRRVIFAFTGPATRHPM